MEKGKGGILLSSLSQMATAPGILGADNCIWISKMGGRGPDTWVTASTVFLVIVTAKWV